MKDGRAVSHFLSKSLNSVEPDIEAPSTPEKSMILAPIGAKMDQYLY